MVSIIELKRFLRTRGWVSETELATHFKTSTEMVCMMLERLEQKGAVELQIQTATCPFNCGCGNSQEKRLWRYIG